MARPRRCPPAAWLLQPVTIVEDDHGLRSRDALADLYVGEEGVEIRLSTHAEVDARARALLTWMQVLERPEAEDWELVEGSYGLGLGLDGTRAPTWLEREVLRAVDEGGVQHRRCDRG
jgi:hypothetical protein